SNLKPGDAALQHALAEAAAIRNRSRQIPARIQPAQYAGTRYLVLLNIEIINLAGRGVTRQHVGLIGITADVAETNELPLSDELTKFPDGGHLIALDVEIIHLAAVAVA